jgi:multidrug transporter EmrE-like cation transporter
MRTFVLLLADMIANTGAHVALKRSAARRGVKLFILWQVVGNLAGFVGVLAYTALMRTMSLHVAYPLTEGLTAIGVQLVGGLIFFREKITPLAWAGTGLIFCGIVLFSI